MYPLKVGHLYRQSPNPNELSNVVKRLAKTYLTIHLACLAMKANDGPRYTRVDAHN